MCVGGGGWGGGWRVREIICKDYEKEISKIKSHIVFLTYLDILHIFSNQSKIRSGPSIQ